MSDLLGNDNIRGLVERAAAAVSEKTIAQQSAPALSSLEPVSRIDIHTSLKYINSYFEIIHPLYPFLDRNDFEQKTLALGDVEHLESNRIFSALYYAVLALGCQYAEDRSFEPATSVSCRLFHLAKRFLPDVLLTKTTLTHLQVSPPLFLVFGNLSGLHCSLGNHGFGKIDSICKDSYDTDLYLREFIP